MGDEIEPLPLGGEDSPWAHDVPIPPPPFFPAAWSNPGDVRTREPVDGAADPTPVAAAARSYDDPLVDRLPGTDVSGAAPTTRRRSVLIAGVVGVVAMAAIGTQVIGGGGAERSSDARAVGGTVTDGSLVEPVDTEATPSTTQRPQRPSTTVATLPEPEPQWVTTQVELSRRLQVMSTPTEVVAVGRDGTLYSIMIPSGEVRSIDTQESTTEIELMLSVESIFLMSHNTGSTSLTHVGGPLLPLGPDVGISQVLPRPGVDGFVVVPDQFSGVASGPFVLTADGAQTEIVDGPLAGAQAWAVGILPSGETVISDTGGIYQVDDAGAVRRITGGDLVGGGPNHYVLRECDDSRICGYLRVVSATGERSTVLFEPLTPYVGQAVVSPDGAAMTYLEYADGRPVRSIVELDNGESVELDISAPEGGNYSSANGPNTWAPDSSGVFQIDKGQIVFCDRITCEPIAVSDIDLYDIVAVAVRPLAAVAAP